MANNNNNNNNNSRGQVNATATTVVVSSALVDILDLPCVNLTQIDEAPHHDPLLMEVEAVPEGRVTRLPVGDVNVGESSTIDNIHTGKYGYLHCNGIRHLRRHHRYQQQHELDTSTTTPSHISVTLLNGKHADRVRLWQESNRNHNMRCGARFQQHTTRPSFDPLGLTLDNNNDGTLRVAFLVTSSPNLPWAHSQVAVGDELVSINHCPVKGMLPGTARDCLYKALLQTSHCHNTTTTTLVFAKPRGDPHHVATTVEKPCPNAKLGFKVIALAAQQSLYISHISSHSLLAPACLTHSHDVIVAMNGQSINTIATTVPPDSTLAKHALSVLTASPRYVTVVTAKTSDGAVALAIDTHGHGSTSSVASPQQHALMWFNPFTIMAQ